MVVAFCDHRHHDYEQQDDLCFRSGWRPPSQPVLRSRAQAARSSSQLALSDHSVGHNLWLHLPRIKRRIQCHHVGLGCCPGGVLRHPGRRQLPTGTSQTPAPGLRPAGDCWVGLQPDWPGVRDCDGSPVPLPTGAAR